MWTVKARSRKFEKGTGNLVSSHSFKHFSEESGCMLPCARFKSHELNRSAQARQLGAHGHRSLYFVRSAVGTQSRKMEKLEVHEEKSVKKAQMSRQNGRGCGQSSCNYCGYQN